MSQGIRRKPLWAGVTEGVVKGGAEPMCHVPYPAASNTEDEAVAAWNAIVDEERARIDSLVGFVSPLDYAWAKRKGRRHA